MKATSAKTTPIKAVPVSPTPGPRRRQFDDTFKREAVAHWQASGLGAGVIARDLGLNPNLLYAWQKGLAPVTRLRRRIRTSARARPAVRPWRRRQ